MKKIILTVAGCLLIGLTAVYAQTETKQKNPKPMNRIEQSAPGKENKPETKARLESNTHLLTNTIQGKSGNQGDNGEQDSAALAGQAQNSDKSQTESGTQASTGMIQGKSGTQGQTTQGETSSTLYSTPQGEAVTGTSPSQTQYRSDDRLKISIEDVPSSLTETLKGDLYKGWDKSTIYYNKTTQEYSIDVVNGKNTTTYRFDKKGKSLD